MEEQGQGIHQVNKREQPDREEAHRILEEGCRRRPGKWREHSMTVASCAEKITRRINGMEPEKAYVLGLLHDIGRRAGEGQLRHVVEGYRYMMRLGYRKSARICITHSFPNQDIGEFIGKFDVSAEDVEILAELLKEYEYDDYDRIVQLCDAISMAEGPVSLEERIDDVAVRYGYYPPNKKKKLAELKEYFEDIIGENLYRVVNEDSSIQNG